MPDWVTDFIGTVDATAVATLLLAVATVWLALQAKGQIDASVTSEGARRREIELLAIRPILPIHLKLMPLNGTYHVRLEYQVTGDYPVLNLTFILRGRREDGTTDAEILNVGNVPPMTERVPTGISAAKFVSAGPNTRAFGDYWELVVQHTGLLGQWVNEHYELRPNARFADDLNWWRLYRLEVQPSTGHGIGNLELPFGEAFGDVSMIEAAS